MEETGWKLKEIMQAYQCVGHDELRETADVGNDLMFGWECRRGREKSSSKRGRRRNSEHSTSFLPPLPIDAKCGSGKPWSIRQASQDEKLCLPLSKWLQAISTEEENKHGLIECEAHRPVK